MLEGGPCALAPRNKKHRGRAIISLFMGSFLDGKDVRWRTWPLATTTSERCCSAKSARHHDESTCRVGARYSLSSRPCTLPSPTQIGSDCGAPSSDVGGEIALETAPPRIGSALQIRVVFSRFLFTIRRRSIICVPTPASPDWPSTALLILIEP